eukprot:g10754.t1
MRAAPSKSVTRAASERGHICTARISKKHRSARARSENHTFSFQFGKRTCALDVVRRSCEAKPASASQYSTAREKHQKSGELLPTDSSKDVVENIIKSETAGAKCSFVDHLAASKDELESKAVQK